MVRIFVASLLAAMVAGSGTALSAPLDGAVAKRLCSTLASGVDAIPGTGPAFVQSYRAGSGGDTVPAPLRNAAFVYDNALTSIALVGCGMTDDARRIADALVEAQGNDRFYHDGRIRNAYRAGPVDKRPVALPGFWDKQKNKWLEDGYQAGTQVGNVAWAALALLAVHGATDDPRYLDSAERMMHWIGTHARNDADPAGFTGGYSGFEPDAAKLRWKSTEHNTDVMAAAGWLAGITGAPQWRKMQATAKSFVQAMFDPAKGFDIGTTPQNKPAGYGNVVLDVQLWPALALAKPPARWRSSLDVAQQQLGIDGGFDFNSDRDGLWTEGTAQAALAFADAGETKAARGYLAAALAQTDARTGWLYATRKGQVTTGLTVGPDAIPFLYDHRPHLGATAWAALAALDRDPFLPGSRQP